MKSKIYANPLEDSALDQYVTALSQPDAIQGALMADAHTGYTLPIGAVIKSKKIYPSYVGNDIGCGVLGYELNIDWRTLDLESIRDSIVRDIPIGKNFNDISNQKNRYLFSDANHICDTKYTGGEMGKFLDSIFNEEYAKSIGTLGGGNHFIELCKGYENNNTWIVVHSGSRSMGGKLGSYYMKLASAENITIDKRSILDSYLIGKEDTLAHNPKRFAKNFEAHIESVIISTPIKNAAGHHGLSLSDELGLQYLYDMNVCLDFAMLNREVMANKVMDIIGVGDDTILNKINSHHNHAEDVGDGIIHRKGASQADTGVLSIIPANMRDGSFIVRGLGNPDSMCSSSHGAGRVMSRTKARQVLSLDNYKEEMKNIVNNHTDENIDEAPDAYKNIFDVMEAQKDLVEIVDRIIPILNIKGN